MCPTPTPPSPPPASGVYPPPPGTDPIHDIFEGRVRELGREVFRRAAGTKESIWEKEYWIGRMLALTLSNPAFKTRLFQFVDVLPALRTDRQIGEHVKAYFGGDGGAHLPLAQWLNALVGGVVGGEGLLADWTAARIGAAMRRNILSLAERFILAETPEAALAGLERLHREGCTATVDLLGEKVVSEAEADAYQRRYLELIDLLGRTWRASGNGGGPDEMRRPNISIKLSTLCSRLRAVDPETSVELAKARLRPILLKAKDEGVFINLDTEVRETLALTRRVFEELIAEPELADWPHLGLVVQAYLVDALADLEAFLATLREEATARAERGLPPRRLTVRLVRGAYWDVETVLARQKGWPTPVFQYKPDTDAGFEACLRLLLDNRDLVRTALGTHNVRSLALAMALVEKAELPPDTVEFQMLHGMGDPLKQALKGMGHTVRIYTPVGDLLEGMAYLVRRLLENTSNESFLRQRFAEARDVDALLAEPLPSIPATAWDGSGVEPAPGFRNASLLDFTLPGNRRGMAEALEELERRIPLEAAPVIEGQWVDTPHKDEIPDPAQLDTTLGYLHGANLDIAERALTVARKAAPGWADRPAAERAAILRKAAEIMLAHRFELAALMVREVGKTWAEADADLVEAVDFLGYYAERMERLGTPHPTQFLPGETNHLGYGPKGVALVIAPWNFPLAISTGMTAAALVTGNAVIYKPAEQSSFTGWALVEILHKAGVPPEVLGYLPGNGEEVAAPLASNPAVDLIAFTGSMEVGLSLVETAGVTLPAQRGIKRVIAEMGGKNALIVDEDADLDEAVRGILHSAFGFGGQKCSACSRLIVLESVRERLLERLAAAVSDLRVGPPADPATDFGPLIDHEALDKVRDYVRQGEETGVVLARGSLPPDLEGKGWYIAPVVFGGIEPDAPLAQEEVFGPVLTVLPARDFDHALELANGTRFALTGGVYSRNPRHLEQARRRFRVGNLYLNRGITGAIVERQPFGGFALSGVGSKAGGPDYLLQFMEPRTVTENTLRQGFAPEE